MASSCLSVYLSVRPSVRLSTCINSITTGWIFLKYNKACALSCPDRCWGPPSILLIWYGGLFPFYKVAGAWSLILPHLTPRLKNVWRHTSFPSCTFKVWCLIKERELNFSYLSKLGYAMTQLVDALRYNPTGRGFIDLFQPDALWPWGSAHPLTCMSTGNIYWGGGGG